jgi:hypothetical protein
MKKFIIGMLACVSLISVLGVGCSSAPTKSSEAPGQAAPPAEKSSPVNLGAASSGRSV